MHANDLPVYIVQTFVVKYSPSSFRCKRVNGSCMEMSDLLKKDSVLLKVFSGLPRVILTLFPNWSFRTVLFQVPIREWNPFFPYGSFSTVLFGVSICKQNKFII